MPISLFERPEIHERDKKKIVNFVFSSFSRKFFDCSIQTLFRKPISLLGKPEIQEKDKRKLSTLFFPLSLEKFCCSFCM